MKTRYPGEDEKAAREDPENLELELLHRIIEACERQVEVYEAMDAQRFPDVILTDAEINKALGNCTL